MQNWFRLCYITPADKIKVKYFTSVNDGRIYGEKLRKRKGYVVVGLSSRDSKTGLVKSYRV